MEYKWISDPETGDLMLVVNGKERARIPKPDEIAFDFGRKGGSRISLDELKSEFERLLGLR